MDIMWNEILLLFVFNAHIQIHIIPIDKTGHWNHNCFSLLPRFHFFPVLIRSDLIYSTFIFFYNWCFDGFTEFWVTSFCISYYKSAPVLSVQILAGWQIKNNSHQSLTFCKHSVFSFFLFRHFAAAILFLSLLRFFLSSSSGENYPIKPDTHNP